MDPKIREQHKKPGVSYAVTDDGVELPIIDITHPAFSLEVSEGELSRLADQFVREARQREKVPAFLQRLFFRLVLRRSLLGRGIMGAEGAFLSGMSTYLLKLGPENLGQAYAGPIDRKIAASLPALALRLRLEDMARLLAESLAPALRAKPDRPLVLLNIAGGPAMDSLNALLLLEKEHPGALAGRQISIHALDLERGAPEFGRRALAALLGEGAPLHGLDVRFHYVPHDWKDVHELRDLLGALRMDDPVIAVSSEGGLFEYGSDEEIVANLETLGAGMPAETFLVGSVTRGDGPARYLNASSKISIRPRRLEEFRALANRAGWKVEQAVERPFSFNVRLVRARRLSSA
jgi:hypothetical protein